jgi:metal-responsive CopG/Arc/MetJ family transcriptional regulator
MNRKTIKTRTGAYHVTLPIRLVEEFDELLSYKSSRSRTIASLMRIYLDGDATPVQMMSDRQILAVLMSRFEPHSFQWNTFKAMIDSISSNDDPSSS